MLLLVSPLEQVAFDIYTPALPRIAEHFAASNTMVQNTVTAYVLGMALVVLPAGLLADAIGRKRVLLAGIGLMTVTSIGCALANDLPVMIGLRLLQGFGGGTCLLLAATVAADCFRGAKLVSVLGLLGAAWGSAPVVAPAIGGFISQFGSWRLVFVVLAALTAAVALLVTVVLPETLQRERRSPVDLRVAAGVLGEALRHRGFVAFAMMFGVVAAAQTVFAVVGPFLYQDGLGFSSAAYGFVALGVGAANFTGCGDVQRAGPADDDATADHRRVGGARAGRGDHARLCAVRRVVRIGDHRRRSGRAAQHRRAGPADQGSGDGGVLPQHRPDHRIDQHVLLRVDRAGDGVDGVAARAVAGAAGLVLRRRRGGTGGGADGHREAAVPADGRSVRVRATGPRCRPGRSRTG